MRPPDDFYSHEELTDRLRAAVEGAPEYASLNPIGESEASREVWCVTLGDRTGIEVPATGRRSSSRRTCTPPNSPVPLWHSRSSNG